MKHEFYAPRNIDTLRMENELLSLEVRYLKARLASSEPKLMTSTEAELLGTTDRARTELAELDLVLLLKKLSNSPFGWIFRRRKNFRILEHRYLDQSHSDG